MIMEYDLLKIIHEMDEDIRTLQDKVIKMAAIYGAANACTCYEQDKWQEAFASSVKHGQDKDVEKLLRKYKIKAES